MGAYRWFFAAWICGLLCVAAGGRASAGTDFCAANLTDLHAVDTSDAGASTYTYRLVAFNQAKLEATMIAQTDNGWMTWKLTGVELGAGQRAAHANAADGGGSQGKQPAVDVPFAVAQSPELSISFPAILRIEHAWVTNAAGRDCDPPSFGNGDLVEWQLGKRIDPFGKVAIASVASKTVAPFDATCAQPFVDVNVAKAQSPNLSSQARASIDAGGPEVVFIAVAVSANARVQDAWMIAHAGFVDDFERTSTQAAKISTYRNAISYCRAVPATYIFRASAFPD
jgi:hypothetical protein